MSLDFSSPLVLHDAEVAAYHIWDDGQLIQGPNSDYATQEPIAHCVANITINQTPIFHEAPFASLSQTPRHCDTVYQINIDCLYGNWKDQDIHRSPLASASANLLVVVKWLDSVSNDWQLYEFYHTQVQQQSISGDTSLTSSTSLISQHLEFDSGNTASRPIPSSPTPHAVVEWIHKGRTIKCLKYFPSTKTWQSTPENSFLNPNTNEQESYVYIGPDADNANIAHLSYIHAYTTDNNESNTQQKIAWERITPLRIFDHTHPILHGAEFNGTLQTKGCPEPIWSHPSEHHWEHPKVQIRFLNRVYATITHGTIALPSVSANTIPPGHTELPIVIGTENGDNPSTNHHGLTLLPDASYLDGNIINSA